MSPGAPLRSPHQRRPGASSSQRASPSSTSGRRAAPLAVSALLSGVSASLSVLTPSPIYSAAGGATIVVSPEIMAAMEREPLLVPDLPFLDEVSTLLVHWATESEAGRFHVAEAVVLTPLLREHLPMSAEEQRELHHCMSMYYGPVHFL